MQESMKRDGKLKVVSDAVAWSNPELSLLHYLHEVQETVGATVKKTAMFWN